MRIDRKLAGVVVLALGLLGCGGSITGRTPDGSTQPGACASLGACECMAASDRCSARTEACWCPSECDPRIACVCGGGRFLACEEKATVASCANALAAVQSKCAGQPFVEWIADMCSQTALEPSCVAGCLTRLQTTGSCSEIDCSFCGVCDCAGPATPSPFSTCLANCSPLQLD
jgi:hypothetical protein